MRKAGLLLLAGCAAAPVSAPRPESHEAGVAACAAAVAAHVGKDVGAVQASWAGATEGGVGVVSVTDAGSAGGERLHTCEVDGAGRVLAIRHPGA
ncbi:MAG TPA: hypothetical protein VFN28_10540 [Amaricoccus sp.]|nr:hypothetical protein [Amaricoccus sp.]